MKTNKGYRKVIALFMGATIIPETQENWELFVFTNEDGSSVQLIESGLRYNTDWNILMPVVKKLFELENAYEQEMFLLVRDELCTGRIQETCEAVFQCIQSLNKGK